MDTLKIILGAIEWIGLALLGGFAAYYTIEGLKGLFKPAWVFTLSEVERGPAIAKYQEATIFVRAWTPRNAWDMALENCRSRDEGDKKWAIISMRRV